MSSSEAKSSVLNATECRLAAIRPLIKTHVKLSKRYDGTSQMQWNAMMELTLNALGGVFPHLAAGLVCHSADMPSVQEF